MSKTLLLADDSVVIQKLVGLSFANEDVEIVSTDNGDDAVARAREIRPDLVLADVVMPGKSGYEVCEAIKQDATLAHIPVLLLTGTFEAFDEARATSVGADGHITKPFEAQALVERVKSVMRNAARPAPAARPSEPATDRIDGLFDDDEALVVEPVETRPERLAHTDPLDVTPSLSEEDLSGALDEDLFAPAGEEIGESLRSTPVVSVATAAAPAAVDTAIFGSEDLDEDLGFDEPLELAQLESTTALDLDSAFDPEPASRTKIQVDRDDANAATSRSLPSASDVTDLDDLLATSAPVIAGPPRGERPTTPRFEPPAAPTPPSDSGPDGTLPGTGSEPDFGFDVSEQLPLAKVDLFEESFTSLLDVSESQVLGEGASSPTPSPLPPPLPPSALGAPERMAAPLPVRLPEAPPERPVDDFDVSSGDLLAREEFSSWSPASSPVAGRATPPPLPPAATKDPLAFEPFADEVEADDMPERSFLPTPPPAPPEATASIRADSPTAPTVPTSPIRPASAIAPSASSETTAYIGAEADHAATRRAVDDLSPVLQQRVHETLEKVAWEAFSDLSETIVKQVLERVERVAWEVIPQMAETLVREEIRKMKGEPD